MSNFCIDFLFYL